jgi:hypothetical protein
MRFQTHLKEGKEKPECYDLQVARQRANVKFEKQTFVLKKPANAVEEK